MGGEKKLTSIYTLAFFVFMANLTCVEDLLNRGTCDWICTAETDIDKESRELMAQGRLVKLQILYEERVDRECANQTEVSNSNAFATLWLKIAANHNKPTKKVQGRLQFFTQTVFEGIFSGHFIFGGYKEINISCIFKSTSIRKPTTNYLSRRLTFHTPQSTLYYVEHLADLTKSNTSFLTLLRNESHTRLSVGFTGATGSLSSAKSAYESDLIDSGRWLFVAIIIWIVFLLYSPAIFIFFRPSEVVNVPLVRRRLETIKYTEDTGPLRRPVQETEDDGGFIDSEIREGHVPPTENLEQVDIVTTRDSVVSSEETYKPSEEESKMVGALKRVDKENKHKDRKILGRRGDHDDVRQDLEFTNDSSAPDTEFTIHTNLSSEARLPTTTRPSSSDKSSTCEGIFDTAVANTKEEGLCSNSSDKERKDDRNDEESSAQTTRNDEDLSAQSTGNDEELIVNDRNNETGAHRNDEERSSFNRNDSTEIDVIEHVIDIPNSRQASEDVIIVGESYPVGVGSFIGNKLFSNKNVNRNNFLNMVKLILIFIVPLLYFTGLVDFFLALLPNLQSKMADHLPFPFLTSSVVYGAITTHPTVLFLIVFSAICYLIRLFFVCFLSRNTLESSWHPCSVHRMHPTCFTKRLLQSFLSEFPPPKSFCIFNRVCSGQHLRCTLCHWFYKVCLLCYSFYMACLSHKPCEDCEKPVPPECSKYLDLPDNISHNLEKQPDIFIKCWNSIIECLSKFGETKSIVCCLQVIFFPLPVVPLIVNVIFLSPLVCLYYGRLWMLNERYKNKFRGSKFILPILEFSLIFFSLVWVTFFLLSSAVPLGVATVGLIKVLGTHTKEVLPHVVITVIVVHYFWSCYRSFTTPYRELAKSLASPYQTKFDELDKKPEVRNVLVHYKLGEQGNHVKVIPKELFTEGCKEFKLLIKNKIALLFSKLGLTLLVFLFVFPIIGSDNVDSGTTGIVITCLVVAYNKINDAINGGEFKVSQEDAESVVDNYIKRKQDSSKGFSTFEMKLS